MRHDHILICTDFSDLSKEALRYVSSQSELEKTKITLIHIAEPFLRPLQISDSAWIAEHQSKLESEYRERAEKQISELAKEFFDGREVATVANIFSYTPALEISKYAEDNDCDLIVLSSQGHGALGLVLLGSVVQKLVSEASCPVMVINGKVKASK